METGVYLFIKTIGQTRRNAVKIKPEREVEIVKEADMLRGIKRDGRKK